MNNKTMFRIRALAGWLTTAIIWNSALPGYAQQPVTNPSEPQKDFSSLYFPVIKRSSSTYVEVIEVTQATQNLSMPVVLVANRPTTIRVYGRTYDTVSQRGLTAQLSAYRNSALIGQLTLTGGAVYPASVTRDTLRADSTKTFNFQVPSSWTTAGDITLIATLGAPDGIQVSPGFSQSLTFKSVPQLNVKAVPIVVNKKYGPADTGYLTDALLKMYPVPSVNVSVRSSYSFSGNLNYDTAWLSLLFAVSDIRDFEVGPGSSTVYYGVIPMRDSNEYTWFDGSGVIGVGFIGDRVSIGVSDEIFKVSGRSGYYYLNGADTAAHEIGHNFDRLHTAGCGAENTDPGYPYSNGIIGQFGLRFNNQTVIPNTYNDIMNYCTNQWVSDFTYKGMYENQMLYASNAAAAVQDALIIRALPGSDGSLILKPVYQFPASPSRPPESSDYSIQLLDESGRVFVETPVRLYDAQEKALSTKSIHFAMPDPGKPVSAVRLLHNGLEISQQTIETRAADRVRAVPLINRIGDQLVLDWGAAGTPAVIRFSTDSGQSWTVLGIDVVAGQLSVALDDLPLGSIQIQILLADNSENLMVSYSR